LDEINSNLTVLNAVLLPQDGSDVLIDADLSAQSDPVPSLVQQSLLASLNRKIGAPCFSLADRAGGRELHVSI
jgi:hypothetical protein